MQSTETGAGHRSPAGKQDPALQAYLLRHLTAADPDAIAKNIRGILDLLKTFEPAVSIDILVELSGRKAAGMGKLLLHLLWEDSRPRVQAAALGLLGQQPERDHYLPELLRLRKQIQSPQAVSALIAVLGKIGRDLPFKVFKPYLSHGDPRVRANTVEALLERLHPRLTEIFAVLVNDPAPRVRAGSAVALWRLGNPLLASLLAETEDGAERTSLAYAAGRVGQDPRLAATLLRLAADERQPEPLRLTAARSLGSAGGTQDQPRLIGLAYRVSRPGLRTALIEAAVKLGEKPATEHLTRALLKLEATTRSRQIAGTLSLLGALPVKPAPDLVAPFADHPDSRVAATAIEVLGSYVHSPPIVAILRRGMGHSSGRVAANACLALWTRGHIPALSRLREMARTGTAAMRTSAAWALSRASGFLTREIARPLLEDPEESVRRWAFEALRG